MNAHDGPARVRIMLVDDHEGFRAALRSALASQAWIELTEEAGSGERALELLAAEDPDIVLMDFSLPGINGLEATRRVVRRSRSKVIALSMHERGAYATRMQQAGAMAWITKGGTIDDLLQAIRRVADGESLWDEGG